MKPVSCGMYKLVLLAEANISRAIDTWHQASSKLLTTTFDSRDFIDMLLLDLLYVMSS